jgi:adenosine deaminase
VVESSRATCVEARLIICTLRHYGAEQSLDTAREAARAAGRGVVTGFDIAGDEAGFPLDPHVPAFDLARSAGLQITAHAGEALGADSVWETLRKLSPQRIGHGVRAIEDDKLIAHLVDTGVHLEVCPSSNVQILGAVIPTYADHPVDAMLKRGLSLSINTDARTIAAINLTQEYERLRKTFGWSESELQACNRAALEAAFVDPRTRDLLRGRFAAV